MNPPYRNATNAVCNSLFLSHTNSNVYATLRTRSESGYPFLHAAAYVHYPPTGQSNTAGWKIIGNPICMNAAKKKLKKNVKNIRN